MSKDPLPQADDPIPSEQADPLQRDHPASPPDLVEADDAAVPPPPKDPAKFTRAAATWSALVVGLLILIMLLVFIVQNGESASMQFLGWQWSLPLGVQILLAAIAGALITVLVGTWRIFQLRRAAKKSFKALKSR
ncbi:MAG: LapA family protein [Mycobacterium sp.]